LSLRQVAVAQLALARMPLERWLGAQQRLVRKQYRPAGAVREEVFTTGPRALRRVRAGVAPADQVFVERAASAAPS